MSEPVHIERHDAIWEITLDRPKANAIDAPTSRALAKTFMAFRDEPAACVAILTGGGQRFFSAGWDLKDAAAGGSVKFDRPVHPRIDVFAMQLGENPLAGIPCGA